MYLRTQSLNNINMKSLAWIENYKKIDIVCNIFNPPSPLPSWAIMSSSESILMQGSQK